MCTRGETAARSRPTRHHDDSMTDIPLDQPVNGRNLVPGTLGDQLTPSPVVLVFLRHFG